MMKGILSQIDLSKMNVIEGQEKDIKRVAKDFEAFFLYILVKEMKKTTVFSKKSFVENTYMDILYEKVSEYLAQKGTGMKDLILRYVKNGEPKGLGESADKKQKGVEIYEGR